MRTGEPPDDDIQVSTLEISFLGISDSYVESSEFLSPTPHQLHRLNYSAMPKIVNDFKLVLDHSNVKQLSKTSFMFTHLNAAENPTIALVHAATITDFIAFNQLLRANPSRIPKRTPLGYNIFTTTFNTGYSGPKYFSYFCEFTNKILI
jgi:hypothetical protein